MINALLKVKNSKRNIFHIIWWWEIRRILYNLILWICLLISILIMTSLVNPKAGEDLPEPLMTLLFLLLCNLGYTLGWLTEIFIKKSTTYGPKMFKIGLYFTLFWTFLPAIIHIIWWIGRGFKILN